MNKAMHIAIFGCGQLAQMTAQAAIKLGHTVAFVADEGEDSRCVQGLGNVVIMSKSAQVLFEQLQQPAVITVEKEMVNTNLLEELAEYAHVYPNSQAIYIAQNRIREKNFLREQGIATADFEIIRYQDQLSSLPERLGFPIYIKAAESGYDGYHQWRIKTEHELQQESLTQALNRGIELIAERHVDYLREVSVIAARNSQGEIACYPVMENRHEDGVLLVTIAPADKLDSALKQKAYEYIQSLLAAMNYVGVLTLECFETSTGLVANELAPRVHNSGHWTIEGCATSQFENHCRAITGMELGPVSMDGYAGLVNMLGKHGDKNTFNSPKVFYHVYGKQERPRRKLGHVTVCDSDRKSLNSNLDKIVNDLYPNAF